MAPCCCKFSLNRWSPYIAKVITWAISNLTGIAAKLDPTRTKHGVSFEEAQTVFLDENARLIDDPDHSEEEELYWRLR
jgi:hypothetical protein